MLSLKIPLEIGRGRLERNSGTKASIDDFVETILTTAWGECACDPMFGFVFNNLSFENFNENEGVVAGRVEPYDRKISGNSLNSNTFASCLCDAIRTYEKRLDNPSVTMTYICQQRTIYVDVKGVVAESGQPYNYKTQIRVWK